MASIPTVVTRIGIIASVLLLGLVVSGPLTMPIADRRASWQDRMLFQGVHSCAFPA